MRRPIFRRNIPLNQHFNNAVRDTGLATFFGLATITTFIGGGIFLPVSLIALLATSITAAIAVDDFARGVTQEIHDAAGTPNKPRGPRP